MTSEVQSYLILELTTALGTLGLAFAQIGPLNYNPITAIVLFLTILGAHIGLLFLTFPSDFKSTGIPLKYLLLFGVPVTVAFLFALYACMASWNWIGAPHIQL
jgi:hypothetical protein